MVHITLQSAVLVSVISSGSRGSEVSGVIDSDGECSLSGHSGLATTPHQSVVGGGGGGEITIILIIIILIHHITTISQSSSLSLS